MKMDYDACTKLWKYLEDKMIPLTSVTLRPKHGMDMILRQRHQNASPWLNRYPHSRLS